ncbi:hypothetical protein ACQP3J_30625, partial [Escherichia coli]
YLPRKYLLQCNRYRYIDMNSFDNTFLMWADGASSKSQEPQKKSLSVIHEKPSLEFVTRAIEETPKTHSLLLLPLVTLQRW